jgi:hypothetical protein
MYSKSMKRPSTRRHNKKHLRRVRKTRRRIGGTAISANLAYKYLQLYYIVLLRLPYQWTASDTAILKRISNFNKEKIPSLDSSERSRIAYLDDVRDGPVLQAALERVRGLPPSWFCSAIDTRKEPVEHLKCMMGWTDEQLEATRKDIACQQAIDPQIMQTVASTSDIDTLCDTVGATAYSSSGNSCRRSGKFSADHPFPVQCDKGETISTGMPVQTRPQEYAEVYRQPLKRNTGKPTLRIGQAQPQQRFLPEEPIQKKKPVTAFFKRMGLL